MNNLTIYEDTTTNELYIQAGPFSITTSGVGGGTSNITTTFSDADSGRRYLVLPLATTNHRLVISNSNMGEEIYTLTLGEERGTASQPIGRLLVDETLMDFSSNNEPELYWLHMPPNQIFEIDLSNITAGNVCAVRRELLINVYTTAFTNVNYQLLGENPPAGYHIIRFLNNDSNIDYRGCQYTFRLR